MYVMGVYCCSGDGSCNCTNCAEEDKKKQDKKPENNKCYYAIKTKQAVRLFTQGFNAARRDCKKNKNIARWGWMYNTKKEKKIQKKTVPECEQSSS